jgi:hypothetical protein
MQCEARPVTEIRPEQFRVRAVSSPALDECCKGYLDVAVAAHIDNDEFLSESLGRSRTETP